MKFKYHVRWFPQGCENEGQIVAGFVTEQAASLYVEFLFPLNVKIEEVKDDDK